MSDAIDKIVEAVLYEGYLLYPYRPSIKNRQRWTFGGLFPRAFSEAHGSDPFRMQTECILEGDSSTELNVTVRFLHLIERSVGKLTEPVSEDELTDASEYSLVPELVARGELHQPWQEATEQAIALEPTALGRLVDAPLEQSFSFPPGRARQPLFDTGDAVVGFVIRETLAVSGVVSLSALPLEGGYSIRVVVENETPMEDGESSMRDRAQLQSMASTHTILRAEGGAFVSSIDPPESWRPLVETLENVGTWPVLVGEEGSRVAMLSSPIILYDHPEVAPESPGDFFDGTEIDEMLTLRILTMTDEEQRAMGSIDERARRLLERTRALTPEQMSGLHGTIRQPREGGTP